MDEIILLFPEKLLLTKIRIFRKVKSKDAPAFDTLLRHGLTIQFSMQKRGTRPPVEFVKCSDFCKRWIIHKRIAFCHRVFTPIVVSVISSIITTLVTIYLNSL